MGKNPAFLFFPDAYQRDTRPLSREVRGDWMDFLCALHFARPRGRLTLSLDGWAKLVGCPVDSLWKTMCELKVCRVATITTSGHVTFCNGKIPNSHMKVTLINRRMVNDERARQAHAKRQTRYRQKSE